MSEEFSIRRFEPEDQEEIKYLYRATVAANPDLYYRPLSGPQLPDDIVNNFSHPNDAFYVAINHGRVVGFCGVRTQTDDRTVASLVNGTVVPEFRNRGIYKALYQVRKVDAEAKGIKTFHAITSEKNMKMKDFLVRDGFKKYTPDQPVPGFCYLIKQLA